MLHKEDEKELYKYKAVIECPAHAGRLRGVEVATNDPDAVPYGDALLIAHGVNGYSRHARSSGRTDAPHQCPQRITAASSVSAGRRGAERVTMDVYDVTTLLNRRRQRHDIPFRGPRPRFPG
ncbi:restriction endonuclease fold toxin-2 domain-containing protein [Streptomyces sioyaensis]|uniref:restriction endonuclease fold toxin-2 domain-containing protein n=1 Tax=Streptomyces sioyaensis TaxID=67364 RepID=UPI00340476A8